MSTRPHAPRVYASAITAAALRIAGTIVLDLADLTCGPALYDARLSAFRTLDGDDLGDDDGTLIVLVTPGTVDELLRQHGSAGAAAAVLTEQARALVGAA
jgi:hypothetical protein